MARMPRLVWYPHRNCWRAYIGGRYRYYRGTEWECRQAFDRDVAAWLNSGRQRCGPTVQALTTAFLKDADKRYKRTPGSYGNSGAKCYRQAVRWIERTKQLTTPIDQVGCRFLLTVQDAMLEAGRATVTINHTCGNIRRIFRWGRLRDLVPATVVADLEIVPPIRKGDPRATAPRPRTEIPDEHLRRILDAMPDGDPKTVVRLLRYSGMRVGEACRMSLDAIDTESTIWVYTLTEHKSSASQGPKRIFLGPQAQDAITPAMQRARASMRTDAWLFPGTDPAGFLRPNRVWQAFRRACKNAGTPIYRVHELRHTRTTELFRAEALERARAAIGHASIGMTARYTHDEQVAMELARKLG